MNPTNAHNLTLPTRNPPQDSTSTLCYHVFENTTRVQNEKEMHEDSLLYRLSPQLVADIEASRFFHFAPKSHRRPPATGAHEINRALHNIS